MTTWIFRPKKTSALSNYTGLLTRVT